MKFDIDKVQKEIQFIGIRYNHHDEPLSSVIALGFRLEKVIEYTTECGHTGQIAPIEIAFSGFHLIETSDHVTGPFNEMGVGPYIISGAGSFKLHPCLFTITEEENVKGLVLAPSRDEQDFWTSFVVKSLSSQLQISEALLLCIQKMNNYTFPDGAEGLAIQFSLSKPTTEEIWKQYLTLGKLEIRAAELYLKEVGGNMDNVGDVTMQDISTDRVLN